VKIQTKKQRVEKYLNQLMKGRYFKIDDLLSLSASKLRENTPLLDISETTISSVLNAYKAKYKFKKEKAPNARKNTAPAKVSPLQSELQPDEILKVRQLIDWYQTHTTGDLKDFEDIKAALADIGMDYRKLLVRYRTQK
jgi:hypothetical protein